MMSDLNLSLVIPVFNESQNVSEVWSELHAMVFLKECIFVDDGSTDTTLDELRSLAASDSRIKILSLSRNYGQTIAIRAGIEQATGTVIATLDGDLQNNPSDLPKLLAKLEDGFDLVQGWRKKRQDSFLRTFPSFLANILVSLIIRRRIHDIGCTLRVMRADIAKDLDMISDMHRFIPILAVVSGARFAELSVHHRPRKYGVSKYGLKRTFTVILDLITIKFLSSYLQKPMRLFGSWGLMLIVSGLLLGLIAILLRITQSFDLTGNPLSLGAMLCVITGIQFLFMGMLGEVISRIYYSNTQKVMYRIKESINFANR